MELVFWANAPAPPMPIASKTATGRLKIRLCAMFLAVPNPIRCRVLEGLNLYLPPGNPASIYPFCGGGLANACASH